MPLALLPKAFFSERWCLAINSLEWPEVGSSVAAGGNNINIRVLNEKCSLLPINNIVMLRIVWATQAREHVNQILIFFLEHRSCLLFKHSVSKMRNVFSSMWILIVNWCKLDHNIKLSSMIFDYSITVFLVCWQLYEISITRIVPRLVFGYLRSYYISSPH